MLLKTGTLYRFENCVVDPARRSLTCADRPVVLNPKTFDVLAYLVAHAGRVVTKDELLSAIWPGSFVEERNLSQHVFLLRKALAENSLDERMVVTVPGRGYQFAVPVAIGPIDTPVSPAARGAEMIFQSVQTTTEVVVEETTEEIIPSRLGLPRVLSNRRAIASIATAAVLLGAIIGGYFWLNRPRPVLRKVVLADFSNQTNEAIFDNSLASGLRIELDQSPFIDILPPASITETLARMRKPTGTALSGDVAREVCERANYQVVLSGSIVRIGSQYVLSLEADNCATGAVVAAEKQTVANESEVLGAMDRLTRRMRSELGEPRRQVAGYNTPLEQASTPSLEALRDYSSALVLIDKGDNPGARTLLQQAVAIDPNFAQAWRRLGANYQIAQDVTNSVAFYKRAFDLRDRTTESERLNIEIAYYYGALHDLERSAATARAAVAIYPDNEMMWGNLSNIYVQMGNYPEAVDAGEHAIRIDPVRSLERLAIALRRDNRLDDAKQSAEAALKAGKSRFFLHSVLFQIAWIERDQAAIREQGPWGLTHGQVTNSLDETGSAAATAGQLRSAMTQLEHARQNAEQAREGVAADEVIYDEVEALTDYDRNAEALEAARRMDNNADPALSALQFALAGDTGPARSYLASPAAQLNSDTLHDYFYLPMLRARVALADHKTEEAIQDLEPARPYQLHDYELPWLRAQAETSAGDLAAAEADYRLILANPGIDPISSSYWLSHLQLARVLAKEHKTQEARQQYQAMLAMWKNADPDLVQLQQARHEFTALQ